jgi:GT2 family glycosyltransferase
VSGFELSVVVSTLGNYGGLARVLDRLAGQTVDLDRFEVVVAVDVADPEPGRVDDAINSRPYAVRRLTGGRPGLSANRNAAVAAITSPLVLFTDNDTLAEPQLLEEHMAWHRENPAKEVGVLGHVRWAREVKVTPFMRWLDDGIQFDYPNIRGTEAGWGRFYGANVSVKRELVELVGGFDEERMPYLYDDLDFGYRASKLGFRLLYNRNAIVEHLREMDLDFWISKVARLAQVERRFVAIHPEIEPYFHRTFSEAAAAPKARGRGRHLLGVIPKRVPLLGRKVWTSADLYYRQQIAPHFLAAWDAAAASEPTDGPVAPYLLEHAATRTVES